jgi:hypothetical protein
MIDAVLIFTGGVVLSAVVMLVVGAAAFNLYRHRTERACQLKIYHEWVRRSGTPEQKDAAARLHHAGDLDGLKKLVGSDILRDPQAALSQQR